MFDIYFIWVLSRWWFLYVVPPKKIDPFRTEADVTSGTVTYEHFNSTRLTSPSCTEALDRLISEIAFADDAEAAAEIIDSRERSVTETQLSPTINGNTVNGGHTPISSPNSHSSPNFKRTVSFKMVLF